MKDLYLCEYIVHKFIAIFLGKEMADRSVLSHCLNRSAINKKIVRSHKMLSTVTLLNFLTIRQGFPSTSFCAVKRYIVKSHRCSRVHEMFVRSMPHNVWWIKRCNIQCLFVLFIVYICILYFFHFKSLYLFIDIVYNRSVL